MKHSYLYIEAGEVVDTTSRFFRVWIGESRHDLRAFARLQALASTRGHYFERWCEGVDSFLRRLLDSTFDNGGVEPISVHLKEIAPDHLLNELQSHPSANVSTNINLSIKAKFYECSMV